jgi:probable F420-dependent oxidoreductase
MKFDVPFPGNNHLPTTPAWTRTLGTHDWKRIVTVVDRLGYHAITTSEHFAMPYEEVPRLGPFWTDALSVLSFVAGATERVRLDASVLVLPYHHPLALAKALATIDVVSGGRLNVSVGVGHAVREFEALGVPFEERGAITDEILEALDVLWREDEPSYHGRFFHIEGLAFEPKPLQRPRPPIYVGGNSKPALRRAARYDGWQPNPVDFELHDIAPLLDYLRRQPQFAGKEETFEVHWLKPPAGLDTVPPFADAADADRREHRDRLVEGLEGHTAAGVGRTPVPVLPTRSLTEFLEYLHWFAEDVVPHVAG